METKPIILLADSQLLFLKDEKQRSYLKSMVNGIVNETPSCAYIGASNGDDPAFFQLFAEAMNTVGFLDCKMITSSFNQEEQDYLDKADLILLAGGDTEDGLEIFREKGIDKIVQKRHLEGAVLIGVSAGAVQLGWLSFKKMDGRKNRITECLKLVPFIVLVHLDKGSPERVEELLRESDLIKRAYEIPFGGGLIFYPDQTIEAIRKPINEYILKEDNFGHTLILTRNE